MEAGSLVARRSRRHAAAASVVQVVDGVRAECCWENVGHLNVLRDSISPLQSSKIGSSIVRMEYRELEQVVGERDDSGDDARAME
jgi:hypothetical protein